MIKLKYEQKEYEYPNIGGQPYDIKVEMELKEHATVEEAIAMYLKFLKIAGYSCLNKETVIQSVEEYFDGDYYS